MTATTPVSARLFVLLAREAPVGVILRRGPRDWTQMIHWDTKRDVFTPGQWFHGRIYERNTDLSPNGQLIVYSAYKAQNWKINPDYGDSWTAVSKPPYFTALALWPGAGIWDGGGYFADDDRMLLNHWIENRTPHPNHQPPQNFEVSEIGDLIYMAGSVFEYRLKRSGWKPQEAARQIRVRPIHPQSDEWQDQVSDAWNTPVIRAKTVRNLKLLCIGYVNHRILMNQGIYRHSPYQVISHYRYRIADATADKEFHLTGITWADFDQRNRLVLARAGKIFSARIDAAGLALTELADFNANKPEPLEAPEWAKNW